MTLKINFKTKKQKAQSAVEYLILFAILISVSMIGVTKFLPKVRQALGQNDYGMQNQGLFYRVITAMK